MALSDSLGKIAEMFKIRFLGMGFLWGWIYCSWFSNALFPDNTGLAVNASVTWMISLIFVAATLFVLPFLLRGDSLSSRRYVVLASIGLMSIGTILEAVAFHISVPAFANMVGGIATGIGCGMQWIMWAEFYARIETERTELIVPVSAVIPPVCLGAVNNLTEMAAVVFVVLLPAISGACLVLAMADEKTGEMPVLREEASQTAAFSSIARIGIVLAFAYGSTSFVNAVLTTSDLDILGGTYLSSSMLGGAVAVVAAVFSARYSKAPNMLTAFCWALPCIVLSLALVSFEGSTMRGLACLLAAVSRVSLDIVSWTFTTQMARQGWGTAAWCSGWGRGWVQMGAILGSAVALACEPAMAAGNLQAGSVGLFFAALLIGALGFMSSRRERLAVMGTDKGAISSWMDAEELHATRSASVIGEEACEPEDGRQDANCLNRYLKDKGLTERELDVFYLLAQGRTLPFIRDALSISRNTVDSHTKSIYRKLDVHSKQEIIDLAQAMSD